MPGLVGSHTAIIEGLAPEDIPKNTGSGAHYLDRIVIETYCRAQVVNGEILIQTVRGTFPEGEPIYPGSKILSKAHTQIAVRDPGCISDIHLVEFS